MDHEQCWNYICKTLIRSAENSQPRKTVNRFVMTFPLLKLLGDCVAKTNWTPHTKQIVWTACTVAFFGSFRMGEILSPNENSFDINATLTWSDLKKQKLSWSVHLKSPKSRNKYGEFVNIFPFPGHNCCPFKALEHLSDISTNAIEKNLPVFMFDNRKLLTKQIFNSTVQNLLRKHLGEKANLIKGHSFRAGIPSLLARFPEMVSDKHILGWGRWSSEAYLSYTRLKYDQKLAIYEKIVNVLNSSNK